MNKTFFILWLFCVKNRFCVMAVQEQVNESQEFNWTVKRRKAVSLLSTGLYNQKGVADKLTMAEETISRLMQRFEFKFEVDRLTFL
jgi:hypothetical protein